MCTKTGTELVGNYITVLDAGVTNRPSDGGGRGRNLGR